MSDNQTTQGLGDVKLHLVDSVEKAGQFITWLGERRPYDAIAIDTETGERPGGQRSDALSPWHGDLRLVQVGDGMQGWSIPWDEWNGVFTKQCESLKDLLFVTILLSKLDGLQLNLNGKCLGSVHTTQ
jgi:hypothetical protein